jgi:hypothetical protein
MEWVSNMEERIRQIRQIESRLSKDLTEAEEFIDLFPGNVDFIFSPPSSPVLKEHSQELNKSSPSHPALNTQGHTSATTIPASPPQTLHLSSTSVTRRNEE